MDTRILNVGDYLTIHVIIDELLRVRRLDDNYASDRWLLNYRMELVEWMHSNLSDDDRDLIWNITSPVTQRCP